MIISAGRVEDQGTLTEILELCAKYILHRIYNKANSNYLIYINE